MKPRETEPTRAPFAEPGSRDAAPTDPCAVVQHKSLRKLLEDCHGRRSTVILLVDGAERGGELVLQDGRPLHAAFDGRIGPAALQALLSLEVVLLRMAMPRTLSRYTRSLSPDALDGLLGLEQAPQVAPAPGSALELEGNEPRDGAVIISRPLMRAAYEAWPVPTAIPDGVRHAVYVFGESDESLHMAGEKLERPALRALVSAIRQAGLAGLVHATMDGMSMFGAASRSAGYGCLVAFPESESLTAHRIASELWGRLVSRMRTSH